MIKNLGYPVILSLVFLTCSCDERVLNGIEEGGNIIGIILAIILGGGFVHGWMTQDKNASSETQRSSAEFGWFGIVLLISVILVLLYKCS